MITQDKRRELQRACEVTGSRLAIEIAWDCLRLEVECYDVTTASVLAQLYKYRESVDELIERFEAMV